jgi:hypothetical protein
MADGRDVIARMLVGMERLGGGVPTGAGDLPLMPQPAYDTDPARQKKFLAQRDWRGIGDMLLGIPDVTNQAVNAGIRDIGSLTGLYDPNTAYQFGMPSQDAANLAAAATGQEIIPEASMPPDVRQQGANRQFLFGALPVNPEASVAAASKAMLIGPMSKLWRADMAQLAEKMWQEGVAAGKPATEVLDEIWKATGTDTLAGTTRGAEGAWKQELPDQLTWLKQGPLSDPKTDPKTLGEAFEHRLGFEAYPELKSMPIIAEDLAQGERGRLYAGLPEEGIADEMSVNKRLSPVDQRSTILHEGFGHGVQNIEGWGRGANAGGGLRPGTTAWEIYQERLAKIATPISREEFYAPGGPGHPGAFDYEDYLKQHNDALKGESGRRLDRIAQEEAVREDYKRRSGEAEARNLQRRADMSLEELKERPFHSTYDIPLDEQIVNKRRDDLSEVMQEKDPEWWHPVGGGVKLREPFSTLTSKTEQLPILPDVPISPERLLGGYGLPLYGDRTMAAKNLLDVNGVPLTTSQHLGGGGRFMQETPGSIWASEQGRITNLLNRQRELEEASGGAPVYGVHTAMGPLGGDFAKMTTRPLLDLMGQAKGDITDKAARAFDREARSEDWGITDWPGVKSGSGSFEEWLTSTSGGNRANLAKIVQKGQYRDQGFPDMAALRKAIIEPELMDVPMLTTGMSVGQFEPGGRAIFDPVKPHDTYPVQAAGSHVGNMGQVPFELMFPDFMSTRRAGEQLPHTGRTVELQVPSQKFDDQWLDRIMPWWLSRGQKK